MKTTIGLYISGQEIIKVTNLFLLPWLGLSPFSRLVYSMVWLISLLRKRSAAKLNIPAARKNPAAMIKEYMKLDVASNTAPARGGPSMAEPPLNMVTSPNELVS